MDGKVGELLGNDAYLWKVISAGYWRNQKNAKQQFHASIAEIHIGLSATRIVY